LIFEFKRGVRGERRGSIGEEFFSVSASFASSAFKCLDWFLVCKEATAATGMMCGSQRVRDNAPYLGFVPNRWSHSDPVVEFYFSFIFQNLNAEVAESAED
jgi:hypothetical protein